MNAFTHSSAFHLKDTAPQDAGQASPATHAYWQTRWDALHKAAAELGMMAQLGKEPPTLQMNNFPKQAVQLEHNRQQLVIFALKDIEAILQPGLTALRNLEAQSRDVTAPAVTLWCEFHRARQAVFELTQ